MLLRNFIPVRCLSCLNTPCLLISLPSSGEKKLVQKISGKTLDAIAGLMAYEVTNDLPLKNVTVDTPLARFQTRELAMDIVLVPVLRAGLGMVDGITKLIPSARVGHVGMYRDHKTLEPLTYYTKLPDNLQNAIVIVLDPMLATGGSSGAAIQVLKDHGAKTIKLVCVVGVPEGIRKIEHDHPEVQIYLAGLDERLNENGYILPGLGDAGDRLFGT